METKETIAEYYRRKKLEYNTRELLLQLMRKETNIKKELLIHDFFDLTFETTSTI